MNGFSLLTSLASRNLWRNRRRTLVILFAIVLGVWAMIVMGAFMRGISVKMFNDGIQNLTGHLQVHQKNYLDDPVINHSMNMSSDIEELLNTNDKILKWTSRIRVPGVVASARDTAGLTLVGINPQSEADISFIKSSIVEGRYLSGLDDKGVIIGKKLAEKLETRVGKRIVLMSQDKDNQVADRGFRVVGIFDAETDAMEKSTLFLSINMAKSLLNVENEISEIAIELGDIKNVDQVLQELQTTMPQYEVKPWHEIQPLLKMITDLYNSMGLIWQLIVFLAMGFGIVNTLLMAVFERTHEFGLFQALGLKPLFILVQVWLEAIMLLAIGLLVGNLASWLTVIATGDGIDMSGFAEGMQMAGMGNVIPFLIVSEDLLSANLVVIILGLLTGLYPAWRASRLVPADAISRV